MLPILRPTKIILFLTTVIFFCISGRGLTMQLIPYSEDIVLVKVSKTQQMRIRFPEHIRKAMVTNDIPLEIKLEEREAYIKFSEQYRGMAVFFIGAKHTYSLMLTPAEIEDPIVQIVEEEEAKKEKAMEWEKGNIYEEMLAELLRISYEGKIPPGYKARTGGKDEAVYNETLMERELTLTGAMYEVTQYRLKNDSFEEMSFLESEFYRVGVVAVSMVKHKLASGEATRIFIISGGKGQ